MNTNKNIPLTLEIATKVRDTVLYGLSSGLGVREPGKMCVEAAVCYAYGMPHGDNPPCVGKTRVRPFKIALNDFGWSSPEARAKGMLRVAIAQLGSESIDEDKFIKIVRRETIKQILPIAFHHCVGLMPEYSEQLASAARLCENEGTIESAKNASIVAQQYFNYSAAVASAESSATAAMAAATWAAAAATAARAAVVGSYVGNCINDLDRILSLSAEIAVQALIECGSPGCEFLFLATKES